MECKRQGQTRGPHPTREETRAKQSLAKMGNKHLLGYKHTPESLAKMSASLKGVNRDKVGPLHSNWKGGISRGKYCPKFNNDLKIRIRAFFKHECILCGKTTNGSVRQLCCHHVEYNKNACCDGKSFNFAALCEKCHAKTNRERARWEYMLHRIIDEIYGGRSYYTKEEYVKIQSI